MKIKIEIIGVGKSVDGRQKLTQWCNQEFTEAEALITLIQEKIKSEYGVYTQLKLWSFGDRIQLYMLFQDKSGCMYATITTVLLNGAQYRDYLHEFFNKMTTHLRRLGNDQDSKR